MEIMKMIMGMKKGMKKELMIKRKRMKNQQK